MYTRTVVSHRRMRRVALAGLVLLACLAMSSTTIFPDATREGLPVAGSEPSTHTAWRTKIDPLVVAELDAQGHTDFFILLKEKADLSPAYRLGTKQEKGRFVYNALRETAERSQHRLRAELDAQGVDYRPYYIANKIFVRGGSLALADRLAQFPEVAQITPNLTIYLDEILLEEAPDSDETGNVEPNLAFVNADDVWALGFTGQGVVLAANDTGIDWTHPALVEHYRGFTGWDPDGKPLADHDYNWWDATGTYPDAPWDGNYHGTLVTGIMLGDDGGDNRIGMAPGAQTIHCKMWRDDRSLTIDLMSECYEWDLAPWNLSGESPDPDKAPHAINNSWGTYGGFRGLELEIEALTAAGIFVAAVAGNEGPSCGSMAAPGEYAQVLGVGTVDHTSGELPGLLMPIHGRGPFDRVPDGSLPSVLAPGAALRSSRPGGVYSTGAGFTSGATPHTVGLVGLLWSANPALKGQVAETRQLIHDTAVPLIGQRGSACGGDYLLGPNNDWGAGTIDALAAVERALAYTGAGTLSGQVKDDLTGEPLWGATLQASLADGLTWREFSAQDGSYGRDTYTGGYALAAYAYGYEPQTITGIHIATGASVTQDFSLQPVGEHLLSGEIRDAQAGWPLYAQIKIYGDPVDPPQAYQSLWSDPLTGAFKVQLAEEIAYTIEVEVFSPGYLAASYDLGLLSGDAEIEILVAPDLQACSAPGYKKPEGCRLLNGGLVVGHVYDANNGAAVNNALLAGDDGQEAQSVGTPHDPAVADGFYILFSQSGEITASGTYGYGEQTSWVAMEPGGVVPQDFSLPAGALAPETTGLEVTLPAGETAQVALQLSNQGELPLEVTLQEIDGPAGTPPASTPGASAWTAAQPMPFGVMEYAAAQCPEEPDVFYILGGIGPDGAPTDQAWRYDAVTDTWTALATLPAARAQGAAACYEGCLYYAGGMPQFLETAADLFIYDIAAGTWEAGSPLPGTTRGAALGAWDGKLFLAGGIGDLALTGDPYDSVNVYDIGTDSWIYNGGKQLPAGVSFPGWIQAGRYLYLVGGCGVDCPSYNSDLSQRYDMAADTWSRGPKFSTARSRFALVATESHLYALGGDPDGVYGGRFYGTTDLVESLDLRDWPVSKWIDSGYSLPYKVNNNNAFCTQALTGGEVWSPGGSLGLGYPLETNLYLPTQACYKQTSDLSWLRTQTEALSLEPGASQTVYLTLEAPPEVGETTLYEAELRLANDTPYGSIDLPVRLTVEPTEYGISVTPEHQSGEACPGELVMYTLLVRNTGQEPDTYSVSVEAQWAVSAPASVGLLGPWEAVEIEISVEVPVKPRNMKSDLATLTFTSDGDAEVMTTATLLTEVTRVCK